MEVTSPIFLLVHSINIAFIVGVLVKEYICQLSITRDMEVNAIILPWAEE